MFVNSLGPAMRSIERDCFDCWNCIGSISGNGGMTATTEGGRRKRIRSIARSRHTSSRLIVNHRSRERAPDDRPRDLQSTAQSDDATAVWFRCQNKAAQLLHRSRIRTAVRWLQGCRGLIRCDHAKRFSMASRTSSAELRTPSFCRITDDVLAMVL